MKFFLYNNYFSDKFQFPKIKKSNSKLLQKRRIYKISPKKFSIPPNETKLLPFSKDFKRYQRIPDFLYRIHDKF